MEADASPRTVRWTSGRPGCDSPSSARADSGRHWSSRSVRKKDRRIPAPQNGRSWTGSTVSRSRCSTPWCRWRSTGTGSPNWCAGPLGVSESWRASVRVRGWWCSSAAYAGNVGGRSGGLGPARPRGPRVAAVALAAPAGGAEAPARRWRGPTIRRHPERGRSAPRLPPLTRHPVSVIVSDTLYVMAGR